MMMVLRKLLLVLAIGLGVVSGLVWGRSRAQVDWQRARVVCIQSDDWGLCGFLPDSTALVGLDRQALSPGDFPEVYWNSTLEDSAMVADLVAVLAEHRGRDRLPVVFQANYIMASQGYTAQPDSGQDHWTKFVLPQVPPAYERRGLWTAVDAGIQAGVWQPELHGHWHYDPLIRQAAAVDNPVVAFSSSHQIILFPESEYAWELGPWRDPAILDAELDLSLSAFEDLFGNPVHSIIAPDYIWNDSHEKRWLSRGLTVIQGQREQRFARHRGMLGRVHKVAHRIWTRSTRLDRTYLDRNCLFEPVQHQDPQATTRDAIATTEAAWNRGEPVVLEAHRINFAHLDSTIHALGRQEFDHLLDSLDAGEPLYLADGELAGLTRRGTSWAVRGDQVVVRNLCRTRRIVVVPEDALSVLARRMGQKSWSQGSMAVALGPGESQVLGLSDFVGPGPLN